MPDNSPTIVGVLEKIQFFNEENHYLVGQLKQEDSSGDAITVAGSLPNVQCGETLELQGQWKQHPRFGAQFQVTSFRSRMPASTYGIRKYLGSGLIPGIGKAYAHKIVDHFGAETFEIINNQSKRLREVPGIGAQRAKAIKESWNEQQLYREVMIFLQTHAVGNAQCIRLVKQYGQQTINILRNDPYVLAREVDGIGFLTADKIAHNLGIPSNSIHRIEAGILHIIATASDEGHTCMKEGDLVAAASELLGLEPPPVKEKLEGMIGEKALLEPYPGVVQESSLSHQEGMIARSLHRLLEAPSGLPPIKEDIAVDWFQQKSELELAPTQREAIIQALRSKVSILTGGPGTGKTTLLRGLVSILQAKKAKVVLASPTGRAAKRLGEATGAYAQTIHRLLGFDPSGGGFVHRQDKPLKADFVIVDESSMLDTHLASCLFQAIPSDAHLLLVGDTDQLPSVGCGHVLSDLIRCDLIPLTRLSFIYRQAKGSEISSVAHAVLQNIVKPGKVVDRPEEIQAEDEIVFLRCENPEATAPALVTLLTNTLPSLLPARLMRDVQILCPLHRGSAGTTSLNQVVQAALNPPGQLPEIRWGGACYRVGDRVIQTRNNYDKSVFNGDVGRVHTIDPENGTLTVDFDGPLVSYERGEMNEFQLAYAISIHKSQGSEYPVIIVPLLKQHFIMLERNLVYTAITRGKQRVYLIGQVEAFAMAVRNQKTRERRTLLADRLKDQFR